MASQDPREQPATDPCAGWGCAVASRETEVYSVRLVTPAVDPRCTPRAYARDTSGSGADEQVRRPSNRDWLHREPKAHAKSYAEVGRRQDGAETTTPIVWLNVGNAEVVSFGPPPTRRQAKPETGGADP